MRKSLHIYHPPGCREEREYIFTVIFGEFLGLSYECREIHGDLTRIQLAGGPEAGELSWPDVFFSKYGAEGLRPASLPNEPLAVWNVIRDLPEVKVIKPVIPVIYGKPLEGGTWFGQKANTIQLGLDVGSSVFFMLTRLEEAVLPVRNKYGNFPAGASLAYREGFLERPIVDEYVEILWACMQRLWPGLERSKRNYRVFLSHDVDSLQGAVDKAWYSVLRSMGGDLVRRRSPELAYRRLKAKYTGNYNIDPHNTFDFILDASERHGLKSTFYVKAGCSNRRFDEDYALDSPWSQELWRRIDERGHEIGLHPSYETYRDSERTGAEFETLLRVAEKLRIKQERWGGRQHYLRWENPTTWQIYEEVGLEYDATVGFADHVGFRCGTCQVFPVFNLKTRRPMSLRERPLIVMECTLLSQEYMHLSREDALKWIERLSIACRQYNGSFSLLWHNTWLISSEEKQLYLEVLEMII